MSPWLGFPLVVVGYAAAVALVAFLIAAAIIRIECHLERRRRP